MRQLFDKLGYSGAVEEKVYDVIYRNTRISNDMFIDDYELTVRGILVPMYNDLSQYRKTRFGV